jgi:predicted secreted protein
MTKVRNIRTLAVLAVAVIGIASSPIAQAATKSTLNETNLNQRISVKVGSHLSLTLHSMYWQLSALKVGSSVTTKGTVYQRAIIPGPSAPTGCRIAGMGCGIQIWNFTATKVGTTAIVATRTTCGEAMRCIGTNGRYTVHVKVIR